MGHRQVRCVMGKTFLSLILIIPCFSYDLHLAFFYFSPIRVLKSCVCSFKYNFVMFQDDTARLATSISEAMKF